MYKLFRDGIYFDYIFKDIFKALNFREKLQKSVYGFGKPFIYVIDVKTGEVVY